MSSLVARNKCLSLIGALLLQMLASPTALRSQSLTLEEALSLAKSKNLRLLQQKQSLESARLQKEISKTARYPTLDFSALVVYLSEIPRIDLSQMGFPEAPQIQLGSHFFNNLMLSVRQPIFTGFRIRSQIALAKTSELSENARFAILNNQILHSIALLYYQAQNLINQQKILAASARRLDIQLQNTRNLFQAGQVMAFDTLQVYNQNLSVKIEVANNALQDKLITLQMARILDLDSPRPIMIQELSAPTALQLDAEQLRQQARLHRPELESIRLAYEANALQKKLAQAAYYPTISAQANYHYAKPGVDPVTNQWMDFFTAQFNLSWNLWKWNADSKKVQEIEVQAKQLSLQERELLRTIEYEVTESYEQLQFSLEQIRLSEELMLQQRERYRILSVQHQNGVASTNDLTTGETDLTRSELQYQLALLGYYVYQVNLRLALGTIDEL